MVIGRVAVDANPVPHLAAQQLIDRQAQRLARQGPTEQSPRPLSAVDVLSALRAGEDTDRANPLADGFDVEWILAHQKSFASPHEGSPADDRVGRLALADESLVGVDADVQLWPVGAVSAPF